jgi:hypothetical protein
MPVRLTVSVLDGVALKEGVPKEVERFGDEYNHIPPREEKGTILVMAFLGHFANSDAIRDALLRIADLYPYRPDGDDLISHILSWDYWESNRTKVPPAKLAGVRVYSLPHEYCEAILHLCVGERLGKLWPRLIHALVVSYMLFLNDPEGPSFEPPLFPNLYIAEEGVLNGYHPIPRLRLNGPGGSLVLISPGQTKREALSQLGRGKLREFAEKNWCDLKAIQERGLGYRRRKTFSDKEDVSHVRWLFRRHVLQESMEDIAASFEVHPSTVAATVADLRRRLDLKAKTTVSCLDHKNKPQRLHAFR